MLETKQKIFQEEIDLTKNLKQRDAYLSRARIVLCCSGIQGGKSLLGALKLRRAIVKEYPVKEYPNANFVVCAPEYKTLMQSTMQAFRLVFQDMPEPNYQREELELPDKRKIFFRTMIKNPNAVEGIPNCVFIWGDEAGQYPRQAFVNIQSRTAFMQGQAFFTTTPYAMNWVKKDVIKRWEQGDEDVEYFEWPSNENPAFPKEEYERQKALLSVQEFRRKYMGIHEAMEGLVFQWDERNWFEEANLDGASYYGGIDWGFDHPFAVTVRAIKDGKSYGISVFKRSGLSASQQIELIEAKTKMFHVKHWACGHDRPDMIEDLNRKGIAAFTYFDFSPNYREINAGNQKLAELISSKKYRARKGMDQWEDLEDEYMTYAWDKKEGEGGKEKPRDMNNDLISAERYCTVGTLHLLTVKEEKLTLPLGYYQHRDLWKPSKRGRGTDSF